ncbi:DUF4249 domain-containing protein [Hymenobacter taeanensis]|uniref:DUF4249 domain-containing protein n=1 Tax=Hymenobacter taeanensis TaxID=2735321 RepID=UPI001FCFA724|nr:DUF4249 domain-containing protein [Hymenobacter taeanensis]UOQ79764.1 DUF4249 domain-containing protein [Hymenobacter sp. 5414T-23]
MADAVSSYLVVDGSINSSGTTTILLKRTTSIGQTGPAPVEGKAKVFIEQEGGQRYPLTESPAGTYTSAALSLAGSKPVRLRFTLANGREYASDFTLAKTTPAIDSITWRPGSDGLQIWVNAHDDTQQSRYYRWSYDETWEFTSAFRSTLEYRNGGLFDRKEDIYNCWAREAPSAIIIGTSVKLAQDVISQQRLALLPRNTVKLRQKYSILVKQYSLTPDEYAYWETLRKNTENIGTLFDPLPSQLTGNVHNVTDASEDVIGYVGAQSVREKRLFITRDELPSDWPRVTGYEYCKPDTIPQPKDPMPPTEREIFSFFSSGFPVPIAQLPPYLGGGYLYSTADCLDCRKRGTNVRPSYWQ